MTIAEMSRRVNKIKLREEVPNIISNTKRDIIELNQSQLFQFGMRADGSQLPEYKSASYAKKKFERNPQPGFGKPDLFNTGKFYGQFVVNINPSGFTISSKDSKNEKLTERYSDKIFGLTKDNRKVYALGVFYNGIKQYVTLVSGLQFK